MYGEFFERPVAVEEKKQVRGLLEKGFAAMNRLARFDPYIAGPQITYADFFAHFALTSALRTTKTVYGWDTYNTLPGVRDLLTRIGERACTRRVMAERKAAN